MWIYNSFIWLPTVEQVNQFFPLLEFVTDRKDPSELSNCDSIKCRVRIFLAQDLVALCIPRMSQFYGD